jgi:Protein of unknown function (DUF1566)
MRHWRILGATPRNGYVVKCQRFWDSVSVPGHLRIPKTFLKRQLYLVDWRVSVFCWMLALVSQLIITVQPVGCQTEASQPLALSEVLKALSGGMTPARTATLVRKFGVDFELTPEAEQQIRSDGGNDELLLAIAQSRRSVLPNQPKYGLIEIASETGGTLYIDDRQETEVSAFGTFTTAPMAPGLHKVRIEKPGFVGAERELAVRPNDTAKISLSARAAPGGTWIDPETNFMWTKRASGELSQDQAGSYCDHLRLADYADWRLPTIDELSGIYDRTENVKDPAHRFVHLHIRGGIVSEIWVWSSSAGRKAGESWYFNFYDGVRYSRRVAPIYNPVALCLRRLGK